MNKYTACLKSLKTPVLEHGSDWLYLFADFIFAPILCIFFCKSFGLLIYSCTFWLFSFSWYLIYIEKNYLFHYLIQWPSLNHLSCLLFFYFFQCLFLYFLLCTCFSSCLLLLSNSSILKLAIYGIKNLLFMNIELHKIYF